MLRLQILSLSLLVAIPVYAAERVLKTDSDIVSVFAGHTIGGVEKGVAYRETLNPNGSILGVQADGQYEGDWRVVKGRLCFHYEDDPEGKWDCSKVSVDGRRIIWDSDYTHTATLY